MITTGTNLSARVIRCLLEEQDGRAAMQMLLQHYDNPIKDACRIYNMYTKIRMAILEDPEERFRNPEYYEKLESLMNTLLNFDTDLDTLIEIYESSLKDQHKYQSRHKWTFFSDPDVEMVFKRILPLIDCFYDFSIPGDVYNAKLRMDERRSIDAQFHMDSNIIHSIDANELNHIRSICLDTIEEPITSRMRWSEAVVALQILSGRRTHEILLSLQVSSFVELAPHIIELKGIAKQDTLVEDKTYRLPLVCTVSQFRDVIERIREYEPLNHASVPAATHKRITRAANRLFGMEFSHTIKRNLFCEIAWNERNKSGFMVACSKKQWFSLALGHVQFKPDATDRYQTLVVHYS